MEQKNLTLGALLSKSFSNLGYSMFVTGSLLAATITSAAAEGEKNPWTYWVGAGAHFFEADDAAETGALYEARVGYALNPNLELEVGLGGGPFYEGNDHNAPDPKEGTYNGYNSPGENWAVKSNFGALYHLDGSADKKLDPYVSAMAGMAYLGKQRDESQNWAPYAGPGFGVSYWFNPDLAVRADYSLLAFGSHVDINHEALLLAFYRFGGSGDQNGVGGGKGGDLGGQTTTGLKTIYFDFDKSSLSGDAQQLLKENAEWMKANPGRKVSIEGHCDERGTNEYNMALGARRAKSAYDYVRTLGIEKDQLSTTSYGEEFPADAGHNQAAWSKNRRVESIAK